MLGGRLKEIVDAIVGAKVKGAGFAGNQNRSSAPILLWGCGPLDWTRVLK
jgi:hypothetical protein